MNRLSRPPASVSASSVGVAGPIEERAVGVDQVVEPVDQNADRQAVENWPAFTGISRVAAVARGARRGYRRCGRLGAEIVRRLLAVIFCDGFFEAIAELTPDLLKRVALDGAERRRFFGWRRRESQNLGRRLLRFSLDWRGLRWTLRQRR